MKIFTDVLNLILTHRKELLRGTIEVARIISVILKVDMFKKYLLSKNESNWFPAFKELMFYCHIDYHQIDCKELCCGEASTVL